MVSSYYAERVNIWLNYTLQSMPPQAPPTAANSKSTQHSAPGDYTVYPNMDCNFDDIQKCDGGCTVQQLETLCNGELMY
jgi:hypothetical protein